MDYSSLSAGKMYLEKKKKRQGYLSNKNRRELADINRQLKKGDTGTQEPQKRSLLKRLFKPTEAEKKQKRKRKIESLKYTLQKEKLQGKINKARGTGLAGQPKRLNNFMNANPDSMPGSSFSGGGGSSPSWNINDIPIPGQPRKQSQKKKTKGQIKKVVYYK